MTYDQPLNYFAEKEHVDDTCFSYPNNEGSLTICPIILNIPNAEHAVISKAMIDFGFRKRSFNSLLSPAVDVSTVVRLREDNDIFHASCQTFRSTILRLILFPKAFCPPGTCPSGLAVAVVLPISIPFGGFPLEVLVFGANVCVEVFGNTIETVFE